MGVSDIPWDASVEFFQAGPNLSVITSDMTLRDAVELFLEMTRQEQNKAGIALHRAITVMIEGRPAALGFMNAEAIRRLAMEPTFPTT